MILRYFKINILSNSQLRKMLILKLTTSKLRNMLILKYFKIEKKFDFEVLQNQGLQSMFTPAQIIKQSSLKLCHPPTLYPNSK